MRGVFIALLLFFVVAGFPAWGKAYEDVFTPKANQAYFEDINVWVYTSEFAKRFGMPKKWVDDDLKGAYAAAFRVETVSGRMMFPHKGPGVSRPTRDCILDVYLPSDVKIPWVSDQVADFKSYTPSSPTYLMPQAKADQDWFWRSVGVAHPGIHAHKPLVRLDGGTLFIRVYDKQLYPGVTYLSFRVGCMTPTKRRVYLEFCEDESWSGRQCPTMYKVSIPSSFMKRLYSNWYQNSRKPAKDEWKSPRN